MAETATLTTAIVAITAAVSSCLVVVLAFIKRSKCLGVDIQTRSKREAQGTDVDSPTKDKPQPLKLSSSTI